MPYEWVSLDPLKFSLTMEGAVARGIYDTVLDFDENGTLQPGLASDWGSPDDGETWVFTLRPNVKFHDGTTLDANALKAHLDRLRDPDNSCPCLANLAQLEDVEVTGDLEVTVHLTEPLAWFPALFAIEPGMVPSPTAIEKYGDEYGSHPVGTGPFKFVEMQQGEYVTMERFDDYWQEGLPHLDKLTYRVITDPESRFASVRSGDLDIEYQPAKGQWSQAQDDPKLQLIEVGGLGANFIMFNTSIPPFNDVKARRAVLHALDMETFAEVVNFGTTKPATSNFPERTWAYPGPIEEYPQYDPDLARSLAEEVGGISFEMTISAPYSAGAQAMQAMWAEVGINASIKVVENPALVEAFRTYNFQAVYAQYAGNHDPGIYIYRYYFSESPRNYSRLADPELDRLILAAQRSSDRDERAKYYAEFAHRAAELVPYGIVNDLNDAFIASAKVQGIRQIPDGWIRPAYLWVEQ